MLELNGIRKTYVTGTTSVEALKGIDLKFRDSEFVSILGQSGCGKTTLLNIIGGLDKYTSGDLKINGRSTKDFKDRDGMHTEIILLDSYSKATILFRIRQFCQMLNLHLHCLVCQKPREDSVQQKHLKK